MRAFKVLDPVYKTEPVFLLGWTPAQAMKWLKGYGINQQIYETCGGAMMTFDRSPWRVVWTKREPKTPDDTAVLIHEILHLVTRIFWDRDITIRAYHGSRESWEDRSDEPAAYLIEHYVREVLGRAQRKKSQWAVNF